MSKKHEQRTRAQILSKRAIDSQEWIIPVHKMIGHVAGPAVSPTPHAMVRKASRSKYEPHFGEKQKAKLADRLPKASKRVA